MPAFLFLSMYQNKRVTLTLWLLMLLLFASACQSASTESTEPIITWSAIPIADSVSIDQSVEDVIAPYRQKLDSIMNEVIGYAAADLTSRGAYESTLGTFVTRLSLEQCEVLFERDIDVSVMNHHGGLRANLNAGEITLGEVFQVMPFENEMVLLEVPGDVLLEVVAHINGSGSSMLWPVKFDTGASGPKNISLNGQAISSSSTYIMAISDYLANGGGGFRMLIPLKRLDVKPVKLRDIIAKEIREINARGEEVDEKIANLVTVK